MARYVVATRRGLLGKARAAVERIREHPDVTIQGAGNVDRVVIEASPQTADELTRRFGDTLIVEPEIVHFPEST